MTDHEQLYNLFDATRISLIHDAFNLAIIDLLRVCPEGTIRVPISPKRISWLRYFARLLGLTFKFLIIPLLAIGAAEYILKHRGGTADRRDSNGGWTLFPNVRQSLEQLSTSRRNTIDMLADEVDRLIGLENNELSVIQKLIDYHNHMDEGKEDEALADLIIALAISDDPDVVMESISNVAPQQIMDRLAEQVPTLVALLRERRKNTNETQENAQPMSPQSQAAMSETAGNS